VSGVTICASAGVLRISRSRHRAAFLRTTGLQVPLVCRRHSTTAQSAESRGQVMAFDERALVQRGMLICSMLPTKFL
jgi:hypothetical protein